MISKLNETEMTGACVFLYNSFPLYVILRNPIVNFFNHRL